MNESARFSHACGQSRPLRLVIDLHHGGRVADGGLDQPFALIGADARCEVALNHPDVPPRVAGLQVLDGTVFVFRLDDLRARPLTPESPFAVGPFILRLPESPTDGPPGRPFDPVQGLALGPGTPAVFLAHLGTRAARELDRRLWFILAEGFPQPGGAPDPLAYLVTTPDGVFVVDLLSPQGTLVNGEPVRAARVAEGDTLTVGSERYAVAVGRNAGLRESVNGSGIVADSLLGRAPPSRPLPDEQLVPLVAFQGPHPGRLSRGPDPARPGSPARWLPWVRQQVEALLADFDHLRREQLIELRNALAALCDTQGPEAAPVEPTAIPELPPQPVDHPPPFVSRPDATAAVSEETAAVHQAVFDRLALLDQERQGLWKRLRGFLGG